MLRPTTRALTSVGAFVKNFSRSSARVPAVFPDKAVSKISPHTNITHTIIPFPEREPTAPGQPMLKIPQIPKPVVSKSETDIACLYTTSRPPQGTFGPDALDDQKDSDIKLAHIGNYGPLYERRQSANDLAESKPKDYDIKSLLACPHKVTFGPGPTPERIYASLAHTAQPPAADPFEMRKAVIWEGIGLHLTFERNYHFEDGFVKTEQQMLGAENARKLREERLAAEEKHARCLYQTRARQRAYRNMLEELKCLRNAETITLEEKEFGKYNAMARYEELVQMQKAQRRAAKMLVALIARKDY